MKRKGWFILLSAVLFAALCLCGCGGETPKDDEIAIAFGDGQTTAIFTGEDKKLYPIAGASPADSEGIEKTVTVKFKNATKVGLSFVKESETTIAGLMFSVDGTAYRWEEKEFFTKLVSPGDTSLSVRIKLWISSDSPVTEAGKTLTFAIKASVE